MPNILIQDFSFYGEHPPNLAVNRGKRRDFISNLQGKQRWKKAKLNYFRVYN